ncbi:MAG: SDR family oxidoreductase [Proteobacteria bacterium]|nr:SDR family oxidoreductase [Pseudomonadota bacterium]
MKNLKGAVAAVTGCASGIGRELALNLAREGCQIAISDIDEAGLQETAELAGREDVKVTSHLVDVADRERVYQYAKDVVEQHGKVNIVINNAGVAVSNSLEELSYEDFEWLMGITFWGVVYGSKAFLPYIKQQPEGHIVNISSINGFITWPYNGPYCTAKFAVKGFTESLLQEMRGTGVGVSCVHPGGIQTNIAANTRFRKLADPSITKEEAVENFNKICLTTADKAARVIIKGIKKNKRRVLVGPDARVFDFLTRVMPVTHTRLWGYLFRERTSAG